MRGKGDELLLIIVYVDDILVLSKRTEYIETFCKFLRKSFDINDLSEISHCLGIHFSRKRVRIKISQETYIAEILESFGMSDCNPTLTPLDPETKLSRTDVWTKDDGPKPHL